MSLADDMDPEACLDVCQETIAKNLIDLTANLPEPNDGPDELAKKYTILGARLRTIREYVKEAQKATQIGSDSVAFRLSEQAKHKTLDDFADTVEISLDGGSKVKTTLKNFERVTEAVQEAE